MKEPSSAPWYRHRWPWILMAGPFVVIVAGMITLYLAVASNDGLVEEDYYARGMNVNETTAREKKALALGIEADLMQGAALSAAGSGVPAFKLRVLLRAKAGTPLPPALRLQFKRPTQAGSDQTVDLSADGADVGGATRAYSGTLAKPIAGRWHLALEDAKHTWRLAGDWNVEQDPVRHLPPAAAPGR
jgi:uncharacterized protein